MELRLGDRIQIHKSGIVAQIDYISQDGTIYVFLEKNPIERGCFTKDDYSKFRRLRVHDRYFEKLKELLYS